MHAGQHYGKPVLLPIIGIVIGWTGALLLIPEAEYYKVGALMPAGMAFSVGLLAAPTTALLFGRDTVFRLEYVLTFGLFYWVVLDAAQGAYGVAGVSRESVVETFTAIAVFGIAIYVGSSLVSAGRLRLPAFAVEEMDSRLLFSAIVVCFFLGMLRVLLACRFDPGCIVGGLLVPRFASPWHQADIGNLDTILRQLRYLGYLVLPLTVALHHIQRRVDYRVVIGLLLAVVVLLIVIQGGGRRQVGMIMGAAGLTWVLLNRPVRMKQILIMLLVAYATVVLLERMMVWRNLGIGGEPAIQSGEVSYVTHEPLIRVDRNLYFFSQIVERVPRLYPHTGSKGVFYIAVAPIPQSVLPSKPAHRGFPLEDVLQLRKGPGWSWTCSAVCDFYLIGGFPAILIGGLIFGGLANLGNRLLYPPFTSPKILVYSIAAMTLFVSLRAAHEITVMGFATVALVAILYLQRKLKKRRELRFATS